jgi:CubicO group peptidase (beta-lactamase class C family)
LAELDKGWHDRRRDNRRRIGGRAGILAREKGPAAQDNRSCRLEGLRMKLSRRGLIRGSLLCGAAAVGSTPLLAQQAVAEPTPTERARMAQLAADFMDSYDVPGLSVAISISGQDVYTQAFGYADKDSGEALTPGHRFRIASITKPMTSVGIFLLIEAGRLALGSRVFGPDSILGQDYPTPADRGAIEQITLAHLLTHTAGGWKNDSNDPMFLNPQMDHRELIAWTLQNQPLINEPGKQYAYSNFGYCLLGRVIEKISGVPYANYIRDTIADRCAISDMQIAGNTLADRAANEVKYFGQGGADPYAMNVARMDSHGGWIASPSDLIKFAAQIDGLNGSAPLLKRETLNIMTTPSAANPKYAKGLMVNSENNYWHTGSLPGTETILVRTHSNFCWSGLTNTRANFPGMSINLDWLLWHMVSKVSGWHA